MIDVKTWQTLCHLKFTLSMIEYLIIQYFPKKILKKIMFDQIIPNNSIKKTKKIVENFTQEKRKKEKQGKRYRFSFIIFLRLVLHLLISINVTLNHFHIIWFTFPIIFLNDGYWFMEAK